MSIDRGGVVKGPDIIQQIPTGDLARAHIVRSYDVNLSAGTTTPQTIVTPPSSKVWLVYDYLLMETAGVAEPNFQFQSASTVVGRLRISANGDRAPGSPNSLPLLVGLVGGDALNIQKPSAAALVGYITLGYRNA